jgi:RNA polymerase sigma-70 factor (ECF subfamily)
MLNIKPLFTASYAPMTTSQAAPPRTTGRPAKPTQVSTSVEPMSKINSHAEYDAESDWNPAYFERVITQYETRIYRFIYSMVGEAELAQDLTQDTFLSAYRNLCRRSAAEADLDNGNPEGAKNWQQSPPQNNMSAWLYTIARNAVLSEMRRRKVVRFLPFLHRVNSSAGVEEEVDGIADTPQVEPGENLEVRTALRDELEQAMTKVGREKLTALLLHMDGFSYKEICDITGDSLSSVKSQIFRAKDSLRRVLNPASLTPDSKEGHL